MSSTSMRNNSSDGSDTGGPPKKKSKTAQKLANHSKAIAELQTLPSAIKEIRDLLIHTDTITSSNAGESSSDVVGDTLKNLLDQGHNMDEPNPSGDNEGTDLIEILNLNQLEPDFGADLHPAVADSFTKLAKTVLPKEKLDEIKKSFITPQNCKQLGVPRVNPEIWTIMSSKAKQTDFQNQQMLTTLSCSSVALAQLAEKIMQNSKLMPTALSQDILRLAVQAATLNSKLAQDINIKRKQDIKPCLNNDVAAVCNTPSTPELLFGENICDAIKASKSASTVMKSSIPFRKGAPRYTFPTRQFPSNRGSLNFSRPSFTRGGPRFQHRQSFSQRGSMLRPQQRQQFQAWKPQ